MRWEGAGVGPAERVLPAELYVARVYKKKRLGSGPGRHPN
jgi:hypothetical protein